MNGRLNSRYCKKTQKTIPMYDGGCRTFHKDIWKKMRAEKGEGLMHFVQKYKKMIITYVLKCVVWQAQHLNRQCKS